MHRSSGRDRTVGGKRLECMFRKITIFLIFIFSCTLVDVFAQRTYTPEKGSVERKAILNSLRLPVEKELKQKIVFNADHFKVQGNWAFISGSPQTSSSGRRPDYRNTPYRDAVDSGAFDNNFFALLKKTSGKWKVVKRALGCTDVCALDWSSIYNAPKAIFPYNE